MGRFSITERQLAVFLLTLALVYAGPADLFGPASSAPPAPDFTSEPFIEFDFRHSGCGESCCQCLHKPRHRLFRCRSSNATRFAESPRIPRVLQCCRWRRETRHFGASANAATGNFIISGARHQRRTSHSDSSVCRHTRRRPSISSAHRVCANRFDSASDDPFGEPHHRHIAYCPANKHVFIAKSRFESRGSLLHTSQTRVA